MKHKGELLGLWIASERFSHLKAWSPRLNSPQFIPLVSGLNVVYGKNGAGKSQLLRAIEHAAHYRHSGYEGLIYRDLRLEDSSWADGQMRVDVKPVLADATETLRYYRAHSDAYELNLGWQRPGWIDGFDPRVLDGETTELFATMFEEFRRAGTVLVTRNLLFQEGMDDMDGDYFLHSRHDNPRAMRPPQHIAYVPALLPNAEAPVTRALFRDMSALIAELYVRFTESTVDVYDSPNIDSPTDYMWDVQGALFHELAGKLRWNPLFNRRNYLNFGVNLENEGLEPRDLLALEHSGIICLPAVAQSSMTDDSDYTDWPSASVVQALPMIGESDDRSASAALFRISIRSSTEEDRTREAEFLQQRVSRMVAFLPSSHEVSVDDSGEIGWRKQEPSGIIRWVRACEGSEAEQRWLKLAAALAKDGDSRWLLIDEPEQGLHRSAEARLGTTLRSPEWARLGPIVAATHSPELLNDAESVLHIDAGTVHLLERVEQGELETLGLRAGDVVISTRLILLVEGEHDRIVIERLLETELRRLRCLVIPVRGGKNIRHVFDSQFLFQMTDARLVCLLDNTVAVDVEATWLAATEIAKTDIANAESHILQRLPRGASGENRFMGEFMIAALRSTAYDRIAVTGLDKPDILMYLDPRSFGLTQTWDELYDIYQALPPRPGPNSFKDWLNKSHGADFSLVKVQSAVDSLDSIPAAVGNLILILADIDRHL